MKLEKFIEMLKKYPEDSEVMLGNHDFDDVSNFFQMGLYEDKTLIISSAPHTIQSVNSNNNDISDVQTNSEDTFNFYDWDTGDIMAVKVDNPPEPLYCNQEKSDSYDDEKVYNDPELSYAGGLMKFLSAFPPNTPINIKCGEGYSGIIHEIRKVNIEYFTGVDPRDGDVISDFVDELFIEYGVPISGWDGGGSFPLRDWTPWYSSNEIPRLIAEPIKKHFTDHNITLSEEENKQWGNIVSAIKENLYKYYSFRYRLNGSWDSNGYFHPYDKDNYYKKPEQKEEPINGV